jgi:hypothetical protein
MTNTEQHVTNSRGGDCVIKNLYVIGSQNQERTLYYMKDNTMQAYMVVLIL